MGDEVTCEVCGESECWALADWSMGGAPGEYEEAKAMHWRLGYEREKARAEKAEEHVNALRAFGNGETAKLQAALAAARRECEGLRSALTTIRDECSFMFHRDIPWVRHVAAEALAAPAAGDSK